MAMVTAVIDAEISVLGRVQGGESYNTRYMNNGTKIEQEQERAACANLWSCSFADDGGANTKGPSGTKKLNRRRREGVSFRTNSGVKSQWLI